MPDLVKIHSARFSDKRIKKFHWKIIISAAQEIDKHLLFHFLATCYLCFIARALIALLLSYVTDAFHEKEKRKDGVVEAYHSAGPPDPSPGPLNGQSRPSAAYVGRNYRLSPKSNSQNRQFSPHAKCTLLLLIPTLPVSPECG